jgi:MFS family permease
MVESFGIAKNKSEISMYTGMVTSSFAFAECISGIFWGRLSDRIGRKKVLLGGLFGTGLSMLLFGFAKSLPMALVARALGGLLNGWGHCSTWRLKSMLSESAGTSAFSKQLLRSWSQMTGISVRLQHFPINVDRKLTVGSASVFDHAFCMVPWVSFSWVPPFAHHWLPFCSTIIGGSLGGVLASPATVIDSFKGTIFETYPYLLPNLFCAVVVLFGLAVGVLFLEETHEDRKHDRDAGREVGQWVLRNLWKRGADAPLTDKDTSLDEMRSMLNDFNHDEQAYGSTSSSPTLCSTRTSISEPPEFALVRQSQPELSIRHAFPKQICMNILCYGILAL